MMTRADFRVEQDHIFLKVVGEYTFDQFVEAMERLMKECKKNEKNRVLIDATGLMNMAKGLNRFFMGEEIAKKLGNKVRLAILLKQEDVDGHFAETVAVNRGARMKVFTKMDEALEWIHRKQL